MTHLDQVEVRTSADPAKTNPELVCMLCGKTLADVRNEDSVADLASVAREHDCEHPWLHAGHNPVSHGDGKPPWCDECGWSSPVPAVPPRQFALVARRVL